MDSDTPLEQIPITKFHSKDIQFNSCDNKTILEIINYCKQLLEYRTSQEPQNIPLPENPDVYTAETKSQTVHPQNIQTPDDFVDENMDTGSFQLVESRKTKNANKRKNTDTNNQEIMQNKGKKLNNSNKQEIKNQDIIKPTKWRLDYNTDNQKPSTSAENNSPPVQNTNTSASEDQEDDSISIAEGDAPKTKKERIPPIILRDHKNWTTLAKDITNKNFTFNPGKLTSEGMKILPKDADSHRGITRFFDEKDLPYHSFRLPEDRTLKVVIRGLSEFTDCKEIALDLQYQGMHPKSVSNMSNPRTKRPYPMFLVELPREEASAIYETRFICATSVRPEALRRKASTGQCYRCQLFGHSQFTCRARPMCVKCGQQHDTRDCTKSKRAPATCANCGGDHTASYRGCIKAPKPTIRSNNTNASKDSNQTAQKTFRPVNSNFSYAKATTSNNQTAGSENKINIVASALGTMLAALQKSNPSEESMKVFLMSTNQILSSIA